MAWLELLDFRSYGRLSWEPVPGVNLLVGRNASGKTNVLESIGYLATLRSFRRAGDSVLVRTGSERAVIRGKVEGARTSALIEVELPVEGRRRAQVNRTRLGRLADLLGTMRCVVFLPDDLDIVKRGPSYRRDLLDSIAVQMWPGAQLDQQEYERTLRQRNILLKQMGWRADVVSLDVWDERLAKSGGRVASRRQATIAALEDRAGAIYRAVSGERTRLSIGYHPVWAPGRAGSTEAWGEALRAALQAARQVDLDRRVSTVGPHRDDVALMLDDRDARMRASQGEQRCLILAVRVASHRAIEATTGEPPLLLLDDVFSELDSDRSTALAQALPVAQTFLTAASVEDIPVQGRRWLVAEGEVL